jgi:serine/threonine protein kinase
MVKKKKQQMVCKSRKVAAPAVPRIVIDAARFTRFPDTESRAFHIFPSNVIGSGMSATVVKACKAEAGIPSTPLDCRYVAKLISLPGEPYRGKRLASFTGLLSCLNPMEAVSAEWTITKLMSELGIAPKIHDIFIEDNKAVIVMDKYQGTLDTLWPTLMTKAQQAAVLAKVIEMVQRMHRAGVVHTDLWSENIVYRYLPDAGGACQLELAIIDYGKALFSTDPVVQDRDYELWHWELTRIGFHNVKFIRDNVECGPWWG